MRINLAGGELILNLSRTNDLKSAFRSHYSVSGQPAALGNDLEFSWTDFKELALEGMTPDLTILGLIHRYEPTSGDWYLTAARYSFTGYTNPGYYPITGPNGLFNLNADGTMSAYDGGLDETGTNYYDPEYFNNVLYDNVPVSLQNNVRSVRFPWEELKQLHCDNRTVNTPDDTLFTIRFCSISPDYSNARENALVANPHTVAVYMAYAGVPLLNNSPVVPNAIFANHAADFGSACPPKCNEYSWPINLAPKNC